MISDLSFYMYESKVTISFTTRHTNVVTRDYYLHMVTKYASRLYRNRCANT
jgi:hypothetical protein